jgi:osmoprotectant transport system permease protein
MNRQDNPGRETIQAEVRGWLAQRHGIELAATLGFENAYALAMSRQQAEALGIRTIEDLVLHAPGLSMGGDYEFFGRPEWVALAGRYGLEFDELVTMDSTLMYQAVATGEVDVITAFSTDGRIPAFDLASLDDTRGALPPYDAVLLVAPDADLRAPGLSRTIGRLDQSITAELMRAANRQVDLEGGSVAEAAARLAERITRQTREE